MRETETPIEYAKKQGLAGFCKGVWLTQDGMYSEGFDCLFRGHREFLHAVLLEWHLALPSALGSAQDAVDCLAYAMDTRIRKRNEILRRCPEDTLWTWGLVMFADALFLTSLLHGKPDERFLAVFAEVDCQAAWQTEMKYMGWHGVVDYLLIRSMLAGMGVPEWQELLRVRGKAFTFLVHLYRVYVRIVEESGRGNWDAAMASVEEAARLYDLIPKMVDDNIFLEYSIAGEEPDFRLAAIIRYCLPEERRQELTAKGFRHLWPWTVEDAAGHRNPDLLARLLPRDAVFQPKPAWWRFWRWGERWASL